LPWRAFSKFTKWNFENAEKEYRKALRLNPNHVLAHAGYAAYLEETGRSEEALAEQRRAVELDPLSGQRLAELGEILYRARRYDDAILEIRRAVELEPGIPDPPR
jgi:Tfp pilus assembly protein PilF